MNSTTGPMDGVSAADGTALPSVESAAPADGEPELVVAFETFLTGLQPLVDALLPHLRATSNRVGTVRSEHLRAAPLIASMLRNHPELAPGSRSEDIENGVKGLRASQRVAILLKEVTSRVEDTGRLSFDDGWSVARATTQQAERIARRDKTVQIAAGPVREALKRGPLAASSSRRAQRVQDRAAAAAQRAEEARQRAAVAEAAAERARAARALRPGKAPRGGSSAGGTPGPADPTKR